MYGLHELAGAYRLWEESDVQIHVLFFSFTDSALAHDFLHGLPEYLAALRQVFLGDVECRDEPNDFVRARGQDKHPLLLTALRDAARETLRDGGVDEGVVRACAYGRRKLDSDHESLSTHIEDAGRNIIAQSVQECK